MSTGQKMSSFRECREEPGKSLVQRDQRELLAQLALMVTMDGEKGADALTCLCPLGFTKYWCGFLCGKVVKQKPMEKDVATSDFAQQDSFGGVVQKRHIVPGG